MPTTHGWRQSSSRSPQTDHWEALFNEAGVPSARVRRIDEALAEARTGRRGVVAPSELRDEQTRYALPVAAFGFAQGGPELPGPVPRHSQQSREILSDTGLTDDGIDRLIAAGIVVTP